MKVKELRKLLDGIHGDAEVVCFGRDGDGFSPDFELSGDLEVVMHTESGEPLPVTPVTIFGLMHEDIEAGIEEDRLPEIVYN